MFGKFFEACTITLGLYFCLQLSSVSFSSPNVFWFKLSKFEGFSISEVQENLETEQWFPWKQHTKFNPRVNRY
ncbi:MAG: hypothetical protein QNJ42_01990 [Crocosphaera sp.]|nr:hypothetical protein [Crocosphaera sp.]